MLRESHTAHFGSASEDLGGIAGLHALASTHLLQRGDPVRRERFGGDESNLHVGLRCVLGRAEEAAILAGDRCQGALAEEHPPREGDRVRDACPEQPDLIRHRYATLRITAHEHRGVVLQVAADASELLAHLDTIVLKMLSRPNTAQHQELWRLHSASAKDHLATSGELCDLWGAVIRDVLDAGCT